MCRIAIVDMRISLFSHVKLVFDVNVSANGEISETSNLNDSSMKYSHGNVCYDIIKKYACESSIGCIRILSDNGKGNIQQLISALNFCFDNNVSIVNLSLGTVDFRDFNILKKCINKCTSKGMLIVAAYDNSGDYTYPAALSKVIGVKFDKRLSESQYFELDNSLFGINIAASSRHVIENTTKKYLTSWANSFAAPLITAKIYNYIKNKEFNSFSQSFLFLKRSGFLKNTNEIFCPRTIDWIRDALLIQIKTEKNMHYTFDNNIEQILISEDEFLRYINSYDDFEILTDKYDTVIFDLNNLKQKVTKPFLKYKKNIVILNDSFGLNFNTDDGFFKWIYSNYNKYWINNLHVKCKNNSPIIAFYGYEKEKQISILKKMQRQFIADDYDAVVITEQQAGILFGFEIFSSNIQPLKQIDILYNLYKADVFLIAFERVELIIDEVDLVVTKQKSENNNFSIKSIKHEEFSKLYKKIIKRLT